jgi:rfaE bifunctional protein nucleotidyltransferase chain/domain
MAEIKFGDLAEIRKKHKNEKIVFCSGSFDITHAGHVLFFEDCKKHGDILVVMVGADKVINRNKGKARPILNEYVRVKMIDSLKPVDYTIIDNFVPADQHPLHQIDTVIEELRPDVYVVNQDAFDLPYRRTFAEKHGTKLMILERNCPPEFEKISTSKIIEKIKKLD